MFPPQNDQIRLSIPLSANLNLTPLAPQLSATNLLPCIGRNLSINRAPGTNCSQDTGRGRSVICAKTVVVMPKNVASAKACISFLFPIL